MGPCESYPLYSRFSLCSRVLTATAAESSGVQCHIQRRHTPLPPALIFFPSHRLQFSQTLKGMIDSTFCYWASQ